MKTSRSAIIALVILLIVMVLGVLYFTSRPATTTPAPVPDTVQPTQQTDTPDTEEQVLDGEILSISEDTVEFMNSLIATLQRADGSSDIVYITETTVITNEEGEEIERTDLVQGEKIQVIAQPTEGGFEAIRIQTIGVTTAPTIPEETPAPTEIE